MLRWYPLIRVSLEDLFYFNNIFLVMIEIVKNNLSIHDQNGEQYHSLWYGA